MTNDQNKKLVVILLGPPGSGKGTQAILLAEKLDLYHLETAGVIEPIVMQAKKGDFVVVKGKKYFLLDEKKSWETGKLWDPPFVVQIMENKIKALEKQDQNLVMTGSPRTVYEGEELIPLLKELYGAANIKIILIEISVKESMFRNSHRRICELMRHPILYNEETKNLKNCPLDGSRLIKRALDEPEIIEKRFKVYEKRTLPLIDFFEKQGLEVKKINGEQSVAKVFAEVKKHANKESKKGSK